MRQSDRPQIGLFQDAWTFLHGTGTPLTSSCDLLERRDLQADQPTGIATNRVASFDLTLANAMRLPLP